MPFKARKKKILIGRNQILDTNFNWQKLDFPLHKIEARKVKKQKKPDNKPQPTTSSSGKVKANNLLEKTELISSFQS